MQTFALALLPLIPMLVWAIRVAWSPTPTEGDLLLSVPIPLLARIKMAAFPLTLGLVIFIVTAIFADVHSYSLLLLLVSFVIVLIFPITYTLTTLGIRTGKGPFRRWIQFAGVRRAPYGAVLVGVGRSSNYPIYLSGGREDDEFVLTLKNLILKSYKGNSSVTEAT